MSTITLPAPHSFWRTDNRVIMVTGYHVEPSRYGRKPTTLVHFRYGAKAWEVSSVRASDWEREFTAAKWEDWLAQEDGK
jgi:hypothetical protein